MAETKKNNFKDNFSEDSDSEEIIRSLSPKQVTSNKISINKTLDFLDDDSAEEYETPVYNITTPNVQDTILKGNEAINWNNNFDESKVLQQNSCKERKEDSYQEQIKIGNNATLERREEKFKLHSSSDLNDIFGQSSDDDLFGGIKKESKPAQNGNRIEKSNSTINNNDRKEGKSNDIKEEKKNDHVVDEFKSNKNMLFYDSDNLTQNIVNQSVQSLNEEIFKTHSNPIISERIVDKAFLPCLPCSDDENENALSDDDKKIPNQDLSRKESVFKCIGNYIISCSKNSFNFMKILIPEIEEKNYKNKKIFEILNKKELTLSEVENILNLERENIFNEDIYLKLDKESLNNLIVENKKIEYKNFTFENIDKNLRNIIKYKMDLVNNTEANFSENTFYQVAKSKNNDLIKSFIMSQKNKILYFTIFYKLNMISYNDYTELAENNIYNNYIFNRLNINNKLDECNIIQNDSLFSEDIKNQEFLSDQNVISNSSDTDKYIDNSNLISKDADTQKQAKYLSDSISKMSILAGKESSYSDKNDITSEALLEEENKKTLPTKSIYENYKEYNLIQNKSVLGNINQEQNTCHLRKEDNNLNKSESCSNNEVDEINETDLNQKTCSDEEDRLVSIHKKDKDLEQEENNTERTDDKADSINSFDDDKEDDLMGFDNDKEESINSFNDKKEESINSFNDDKAEDLMGYDEISNSNRENNYEINRDQSLNNFGFSNDINEANKLKTCDISSNTSDEKSRLEALDAEAKFDNTENTKEQDNSPFGSDSDEINSNSNAWNNEVLDSTVEHKEEDRKSESLNDKNTNKSIDSLTDDKNNETIEYKGKAMSKDSFSIFKNESDDSDELFSNLSSSPAVRTQAQILKEKLMEQHHAEGSPLEHKSDAIESPNVINISDQSEDQKEESDDDKTSLYKTNVASKSSRCLDDIQSSVVEEKDEIPGYKKKFSRSFADIFTLEGEAQDTSPMDLSSYVPDTSEKDTPIMKYAEKSSSVISSLFGIFKKKQPDTDNTKDDPYFNRFNRPAKAEIKVPENKTRTVVNSIYANKKQADKLDIPGFENSDK